VAVLSVIAFHVAPAKFRGGFVGVDIFFVISGFLISSIIYQELESGAFSIVEFYVRRIRRIYPALFIILGCVCVAGWMFLLPSDFVILGKQIIGGSTFVANFVLWWQSGYFSPEAILKPLLHLWSLGVEEQFYLLFPLICVLLYRSKSRRRLAFAFVAVAGISMVVNVALVSKFSAATYFLPFSRFWELFAGAGLALAMRGRLDAPKDESPAGWQHAMGMAGLILLIASVFVIDEFHPFPGWWALMPITGSVLAMAAGEHSWANRNILSWRPAVLIGLISYPLYLWHWPILSFMKVAMVSRGVLLSRPEKGALVMGAFVLAYLTYRFVEIPIRGVKEKRRRRKGAILLLGSVLLTGVFGGLVLLSHGFPSRLPAAVVALDHDYGGDASKAWREGRCFLRPEQTAAAFTDDCVDAASGREGQPLVLVWGDSHAADLFPGFRALQAQSGVRLAQFTASLCAPILGLRVPERPECTSVNYAVLERVRKLRPATVVLSAHWDNPNPDQSAATKRQELLNTIESIRAAGVANVVVIGSFPFWTAPVPGLLAGEVVRHPNRPVPQRLPRSLLEPYDDTSLKAIVTTAGAVYVPVFSELCNPSSCIATTGPGWRDVVTYDQSHFTDHGSILVTQRIWPWIMNSRS
jgi:peptidoglycan/LPS O-acetylase OafA/YrhL